MGALFAWASCAEEGVAPPPECAGGKCDHSSTVETKEDPLILSVNSKREVFLENRKVRLADLEKKVKSIFKYRREKEVLLKADKDVPYGFVIKVMASVKNAGIEKLGMITEPEE